MSCVVLKQTELLFNLSHLHLQEVAEQLYPRLRVSLFHFQPIKFKRYINMIVSFKPTTTSNSTVLRFCRQITKHFKYRVRGKQIVEVLPDSRAARSLLPADGYHLVKKQIAVSHAYAIKEPRIWLQLLLGNLC